MLDDGCGLWGPESRVMPLLTELGWAIVGTVTNNVGIVPYSDTVPTNSPQRYYRAKVMQ